MKRIIIEAKRETYSKAEAEEKTMTVGELIEWLEGYDRDQKIILSHDYGYTYGAITESRIQEEENEEEEE